MQQSRHPLDIKIANTEQYIPQEIAGGICLDIPGGR